MARKQPTLQILNYHRILNRLYKPQWEVGFPNDGVDLVKEPSVHFGQLECSVVRSRVPRLVPKATSICVQLALEMSLTDKIAGGKHD